MKDIARLMDAREEGREEERKNTERERLRAEKAEAQVKSAKAQAQKPGSKNWKQCLLTKVNIIHGLDFFGIQ